MKRILALVSALIFLAVPSLSCADGLDLTAFSTDELEDLAQHIKWELEKRHSVMNAAKDEDSFLYLIADKVRKLAAAYDFAGIISLCEKGNPEEEALQYIISLCNECVELLSHCDAYPTFPDSSVALYYRGLPKSFEETSVYPYLDGAYFFLDLGFVSDSWVFFDFVELYADGVLVDKFDAKGKNRDVLSGGMVKEYSLKYHFYLDTGEIASAVYQAQSVSVRFVNKKTEAYLERTLSQSEVDALYCMTKLMAVRRELTKITD